MATKKDLVEAHSFSRRRLVTAFLSGAPGGREVEPARPGRTIVGGFALALLLVAGAAIASVLASRTEENWNKVGLVVSQKTSAQFVILEKSKHPTLIPVTNITSAQLILGTANTTPTYVDQSIIDSQTPGDTIGILGAPQLLPQPSQFIDQGWTSCTDDGLAMTINLSRTQHTASERGHGAVVKTVDPESGEPTYYLVATSSSREGDAQSTYVYPMKKSGRIDTALGDIGMDDEAQAVQVPESWVQLFPTGGTLDADSFDIDDFGQPPPEGVARYLPDGTTVGQYVEDGANSFVVTDEGKVALDPFALAIYKQTQWRVDNKRRTPPSEITADVSSALPGGRQVYDDAHWPDSTLEPVTGQLCAQLDVHADQEPRAFLRGDPTATVAASESSTTDDSPVFSIDRGQGAYVMQGEWGESSSGSSVVIDPRGKVFPLIGTDTIAKLGYDSVDPPLVPDTWTRLLSGGVALSTNAALCPPVETAVVPAGDAAPDDSTATAEGATPNCQTDPGASAQ